MNLNIKRYIAAMVDLFISIIAASFVIMIVKNLTGNVPLAVKIGMASIPFLFIIKDISGRSIGKRLMRLKIVNKSDNSSKPKWYRLILHNITLPIWTVEFICIEMSAWNEKLIDRALEIRIIDLNPLSKRLI